MPKGSVDIRLEGLEEVQQRLRQIEEKIGQKETQKILKLGTRIIADDMRSKAPRDEGRLEASISDQKRKKDSDLAAGRVVGPRTRGKNRAPHAHLAELGVRGGVFKSKKGFVLKTARGYRRVKTIYRQPVGGYFFIDRAFKEKSPEAVKRINQGIDKIVQTT